ncbi:hypothetical protein FRB93_003655 [Tulasnella sp. JGI-2019a]|nr:hypothetical protein FRB93_003655 [Tulasnella sp. JGI-2019a]
MSNGDVKKYLSVNPNVNRVQLIHEIALGILYIHGKNIVHGDLKSVNVLIDDALKARIADFGLSEIKHHATSSLAIQNSEAFNIGAGTLRYMAPEALRGDIDKASDVYAFAMTVYEVGNDLFRSEALYFTDSFGVPCVGSSPTFPRSSWCPTRRYFISSARRTPA